MIDESSYSEAVADELSLTSSAYAEDVTGEVDLTSAAYGEDVADAINEGVEPTPTPTYDLRVCQYNIGHFNMGTAGGPTGTNPTTDNVRINSNKSDGYPSSTNRNYATQLSRWGSFISGNDGVNADIMGMPEWNNYFGYNNGTVVTTAESGIFNGYNISAGKTASSGWWQNTLLAKSSKYSFSNAVDIDLGSTNGNMAYVRLATVSINGKNVLIGVTHLNWNNPYTAGGASGSYSSRQTEIKNLIKLLEGSQYGNYDYIILFGDFNTTGAVYADSVPYSQRDFLAGLSEFDPFVEGFDEETNGVTKHYGGGYTLANNKDNPLLTADATNSRPDLTDGRPHVPYCYIDNIIVKGFTMSNITVVDDGRLTDHCALWCDLTMIEEGGES